MAKLTGLELLALRDALKAAIPTENDFFELLMALDRRLTDYAASREPYPRQILLTLVAANDQSWLYGVVERALAIVPGDPDLRLFAAQLKLAGATASPSSHFDVCCLSGGHVMVDRARLRAALKTLHDPFGKRILVVTDDTPVTAAPNLRVQTGKSHSRRMIAHLRQTRGNFRMVEIDLERMRDALRPGALIEPRDLAASIVKQMGYDGVLQEPPSDAQWARWTLDFCDWFFGLVSNGPDNWWLVVDSFNVVLLPPQTQDLLKELANRINAALSNVRMILLGYGGTFHPAVTPTVEHEAVRLFGEPELAEFFARAFRERGIPFDDDKVADSVIRVLDGLDRAQPDFVARVGTLVARELVDP